MTIAGFNIDTLIYVVLAFFLFVMFYRYHYNKLAQNNMRIFFCTDEGTGYYKWMPIVDGILVVQPSKTRAGAEYPVGNLNTVIIDYPEHVPALLSFIQVKAKMTVLDEHTAEPILNRSAYLNLSPQSLYNAHNERFTGLAAGQSMMERREIDKEVPKQIKSGMSTTKWVVIFIAIAVIAVIGLVVWQNYTGNNDSAALGLP